MTAREPAPEPAILLVDDDPINRCVGVAMLSRLGYRNISVAQDGCEAVETCRQECFDIVLMDCHMPKMDGWEATQAIRALGVREPIIAFTASASAADRARCLASGMNDWLAKPAAPVTLAKKLQQWLASKNASSEASDYRAGHAIPALPVCPL